MVDSLGTYNTLSRESKWMFAWSTIKIANPSAINIFNFQEQVYNYQIFEPRVISLVALDSMTPGLE